MSILTELNQTAEVTPLAGIEDAWTWSVGNGWFHYALTLSTDGSQAFQLNCNKGWTTDRAVAVLDFVRRNEQRSLAAAPFAVLPGFALPGKNFDCVAVVLPTVAQMYLSKDPLLAKSVYAVFPAWRCEFSGDEDEAEASRRYKRVLETADWDRGPEPFLRWRYVKASGQQVSLPGDRRGLAGRSELATLLKIQRGAARGFVELENFRGQVHRIDWRDGRTVLRGGDQEQFLSEEELTPWIDQFLIHGMED